jgi:hypothetical protein
MHAPNPPLPGGRRGTFQPPRRGSVSGTSALPPDPRGQPARDKSAAQEHAQLILPPIDLLPDTDEDPRARQPHAASQLWASLRSPARRHAIHTAKTCRLPYLGKSWVRHRKHCKKEYKEFQVEQVVGLSSACSAERYAQNSAPPEFSHSPRIYACEPHMNMGYSLCS